MSKGFQNILTTFYKLPCIKINLKAIFNGKFKISLMFKPKNEKPKIIQTDS